MLDQIYGRPSSSYKRTQVLLVLFFWLHRLVRGSSSPPPFLPFARRIHRYLLKRSFSPWQIILSTLVTLYAIKNSDALLGLQAPEPLSRLYSKSYYRATWIVTALDAGFATAMTIKPKWLRDLFSIAFSAYYLVFAGEADEKLRKFRAVCTVEMLRTTWEKTSNPYIRFVTRGDRPSVKLRKKILLPRPVGSTYKKPITAHLFFAGTEPELATKTELIFDVPGGGFICMTPEHHEERLLRWTRRTGLPVISFDYGKAPEYPFPFAIDEIYDAYKLLYETKGKSIGMNGSLLRVVMTGDSAGANISTAFLIKLLETPSSPSHPPLPLPIALVYAYAALSFHFTSWMPSSDLRVLREKSSGNIASILRGKDHLDHRSPLSVVDEDLGIGGDFGDDSASEAEDSRHSLHSKRPTMGRRRRTSSWGRKVGSVVGLANWEREEDEEDKSLQERVVWWEGMEGQKELQGIKEEVGKRVERERKGMVAGTRLAMTSRTAFFNDRIISPPMCRAMALLYIGPRNAPDLHSDYHISPIFTPPNLLAQFPPVYLSCGERDPFVDDTVIFAGKLREAKESRKLELLKRETKFGESLRMTGASSKRDSIVDEDEEDWVQMRIISGWSHGYLQMSSLLPGAGHAIDMMADWITTSFKKYEQTHPSHLSRSSTLPATLPAPTPSHRLPIPFVPFTPPYSSPLPSSTTPSSSTSSSSVPTTLTHKVNGNSIYSPDTSVTSTSEKLEVGEESGSNGSFPFNLTRSSTGSSTSSGTAGGSLGKKSRKEVVEEEDEEVLSFTPKKRGSRTASPAPSIGRSEGGHHSPPHKKAGSSSLAHSERLDIDELVDAEAGLKTRKRDLAEEVRGSLGVGGNLESTGNGKVVNGNGLGSRRFTDPPPIRPASTITTSSPPSEELVGQDGHLRPPKASVGQGKGGRRSGSAGALEREKSGVFIDAKDLLKRRRVEAVFGMGGSGEEDSDEDEDERRKVRERQGKA